ncbi:hypothetical protein [Alkaliphilus hydrothermalis]|uniref:Integral membrane protein n=1 Tax=Alkaliphilus hydrothermalis TaxID=1482730 RepID=A0ABS2NLT5_9FIRM|nr:hypothetical protein [Alkaliphilus hydrothermalis]MBM7613872.1 hypothetical protein [Alkaliphilus hydrothermalis]
MKPHKITKNLIQLLLTELLFFINAILVLNMIPMIVPVFSRGGGSHAIFTLRQVIYSPQDYLLSFTLFLLGVSFLSGMLVRALIYAFYQWKLTGFILRFFFTSWSLSIFSTTFYLSFYYMAMEGIIIGVFICVFFIFIYFSRNIQSSY